MKNKDLKILALFLAIVFIMPASAVASRFLVQIPENEESEPYVSGIYILTEGEDINAIQGTISLADKSLLNEIRFGNSIISFWVEEPHYEESSGGIVFSGIIPNGFRAEEGHIFTLSLKSKAKISAYGMAYKNDGKGGQIALTTNKTRVENGEILYKDTKEDNEPPERFLPIVEKTDTFGEGKYALFFATQDKLSGISSYQVAEAKPKWFFFEPEDPLFKEQSSPYILNDQDRKSFVLIKAIDKNGNETLEKISPASGPYKYRDSIFWFIMGIVALAGLSFAGRRKKQG